MSNLIDYVASSSEVTSAGGKRHAGAYTSVSEMRVSHTGYAQYALAVGTSKGNTQTYKRVRVFKLTANLWQQTDAHDVDITLEFEGNENYDTVDLFDDVVAIKTTKKIVAGSAYAFATLIMAGLTGGNTSQTKVLTAFVDKHEVAPGDIIVITLRV